MRLIPALFLAATLALPALAREPGPAEDAEKALQAGDLDALYTGGRRFHKQAGPGVFAAPNGNRGKPPPVQLAAPQDGPVDQAEIEKYLKFDGGMFAKKERQFFRDMTDKLQKSESGRKILRAMLADAKKNGDTIRVRPADYNGSAVVTESGLEMVFGIAGMSREGGGEPRTFEFNRKFLDFKDRDAALNMAAANMGHELSHLLLHSRYREQLKDYADVLDFALVDEQNARVKGFLVAMEINEGKPNGTTSEAVDFSADVPSFLDQMKLWDEGYAISLQQVELREPLPVYDRRISGLLERADDFEGDIKGGLDRTISQIDHMKTAHAVLVAQRSLAVPLTLLREKMLKFKEAFPHDLAATKEAVDAVYKLTRKLDPTRPEKRGDSPVRPSALDAETGRNMLARMRALSYDPRYASIIAEVRADEARLAELVKTKKIAPPPPGQETITRGKFGDLFEELHGAGSRDKGSPWSEK